MELADVIDVIQLLENNHMVVWVDGGWGVDALLGEQSRPHSDVDIVIQQQNVLKLRELLTLRGYQEVERPDTSSWNFVMGDAHGRLVDVHVIVFDHERNGLYGLVEKGVMYPAGSLTGTGILGGHPVQCISAGYMVKFHTGYDLREKDYKDVSALCLRFGIELPEEYSRFRE